MKKQYHEDELLALSGIQHIAFCPRQWGLIHIEKQWVENVHTIEGKHLHHRVDDPYLNETRGDVKTVRSVPIVSKALGLYGVADLMEIYTQSVPGAGEREGKQYSIVEYKRGKPKTDDRDEVQLCAQAICLEEMLGIKLDKGYLYYGTTKHRHQVMFNSTLRERVKKLATDMHDFYARGVTPPATKGKHCKSCSLVDICVPKLADGNARPALYLNNFFKEIKEEDGEDNEK